MLKSVWHVVTAEMIAQLILASAGGLLAGLGVRIGAPGVTALGGIPLMVLIHRRRLKDS
jgi:hypothetical protein